MSDGFGHAREGAATATTNLASTMGVASGLVAANVALMLVLSYTPVVDLGRVVFSNFFLGIAVFAATVGGGHWLSTGSLEKGNVALAAVGVALIQFGYGLFGSTLLAGVESSLRVPALGISAVITAAITALVTVVVYRTDHSFERWNLYSAGLFVGGLVLGAVGVFVASLLLVVAGLCFFLGFIAYLFHEVWAVKTSAYPGTLINAIGIYVAVMGVFVHVLSWVLRILSMLDQ
jgi:hypothetical protein